MIVLRVVVLPAPLRPTRQTTSRAPTSSDTPRRTWLVWMKTSISTRVSIAWCSRHRGLAADHGVDHALVRQYRRGRRVGQHAALVERDDPVRVRENDVHVVLHLDDGSDPDPPRRRHE